MIDWGGTCTATAGFGRCILTTGHKEHHVTIWWPAGAFHVWDGDEAWAHHHGTAP